VSPTNSPVLLQQGLSRLKSYLNLAEANKGEPALYDALRTASIQAFEYCYALALKAIERELEGRMAAEILEGFNFRTFIRAAWEAGLVERLEDWDRFRELRNTTSHTYDDAKAAMVFAALPDFARAVKHLLARMEERADAH